MEELSFNTVRMHGSRDEVINKPENDDSSIVEPIQLSTDAA